jgi:hypothetical protein
MHAVLAHADTPDGKRSHHPRPIACTLPRRSPLAASHVRSEFEARPLGTITRTWWTNLGAAALRDQRRLHLKACWCTAMPAKGLACITITSR